jgi:hypothetical protein
MDLNLEDYYALLHPLVAIAAVFPMLGLIARLARQTRQRRLQSALSLCCTKRSQDCGEGYLPH